jgi:hypothetical protein
MPGRGPFQAEHLSKADLFQIKIVVLTSSLGLEKKMTEYMKIYKYN